MGPEEKQRIKDLARKMKEEAQSKKDKKSGGVLSFEAMLGGLDSKTKPKTVKTPMIKNKTAALLEGMKSPSSSSSKSSSTIKSSSSSSLNKKDSSSSRNHHRDHSSS